MNLKQRFTGLSFDGRLRLRKLPHVDLLPQVKIVIHYRRKKSSNVHNYIFIMGSKCCFLCTILRLQLRHHHIHQAGVPSSLGRSRRGSSSRIQRPRIHHRHFSKRLNFDFASIHFFLAWLVMILATSV